MIGLQRYMTESNSWDKCVAHIRKYRNTEDIYKEWEQFDIDEQMEMLAEAGFIGFVMQDEIDDGCITTLIHSTSRNDMCGYIDDELSNRAEGYDVEDTNHYVVKYKGGKPLHTEDEFVDKKKLPRTNIEWMCCNPGIVAEICYFSNEKAKEEMIKYMDLVEFKKTEMKRIEQGIHDWV